MTPLPSYLETKRKREKKKKLCDCRFGLTPRSSSRSSCATMLYMHCSKYKQFSSTSSCCGMDGGRKSCCRRGWAQWPITQRLRSKPAAPSWRQQVLQLCMTLCRPSRPLRAEWQGRVSGRSYRSTWRGRCCECLAWIPSVSPTF